MDVVVPSWIGRCDYRLETHLSQSSFFTRPCVMLSALVCHHPLLELIVFHYADVCCGRCRKQSTADWMITGLHFTLTHAFVWFHRMVSISRHVINTATSTVNRVNNNEKW
ncbi:hypothetical protein CBL_01820 [Carabus blaptoides fortunei]